MAAPAETNWKQRGAVDRVEIKLENAAKCEADAAEIKGTARVTETSC